MRFETYRETLSSFARTAKKIEAFARAGSPGSIDSRPPELRSPVPPPCLYTPKLPLALEIPDLAVLKTLHSLCAQKRSMSANQAAWNHQFLSACHEFANALPSLVSHLHPKRERRTRAVTSVSDTLKALKVAARVRPRKQRLWNSKTVDAVYHLVQAHKCIGQTKLARAGLDGDYFGKMSARLKSVKKANDRAVHGLRVLLGRMALNQRSINHDLFRILESLLRMHSHLRRHIAREQARDEQRRFRSSTLALNSWLLVTTERLTSTITGRLTHVGGELAAHSRTLAAQAASMACLQNHALPAVRPERQASAPQAPCSALASFPLGPARPNVETAGANAPPAHISLNSNLPDDWHCTNKRVVEHFWALSHVPPSAKTPMVFGAGFCSSLLALELASSGYRVTSVHHGTYNLHHPNLHTLVCDLSRLPLPDAHFDTALYLSAIEDVGLAPGGGELLRGKDVIVIQEARRVLKPGGTLILTTPYGVRNQLGGGHILDAAGLAGILQGFEVVERSFAIRRDHHVWERCNDETEAARQCMTSDGMPGAVALIVAHKI